MSIIDTASIINLVAQKAKAYEPIARNFAQSRFLLASIEYGQNEEEIDALQKIAEGIQCKISASETGVSQDIDFDDNDSGNYLEIIDQGMPAPLAGGSGGFAHNPDGSVYRSLYPEHLWGSPLEELSKPGSDTLDEVRKMLSQLFADEVRNIIAESKSDIAAIAKRGIVDEINSILRK